MRASRAAGRSVARLEQRGRAGLAGVESELAEPFGELVGADRAAGLSAGEQPAGGSLVAEGGVSAAGGDRPTSGRRGARAGRRARGRGGADAAVAGVDVVEGEPADRGGPLGVEQNEQAGDAVFGFDRCRRAAAGGRGASGPRCR